MGQGCHYVIAKAAADYPGQAIDDPPIGRQDGLRPLAEFPAISDRYRIGIRTDLTGNCRAELSRSNSAIEARRSGRKIPRGGCRCSLDLPFAGAAGLRKTAPGIVKACRGVDRVCGHCKL